MTLTTVYEALYAAYGPQRWWPGETPFEVMVGAILTQNTAWPNVERAIANLAANGALDPTQLVERPAAEIAEWIRPSGYFNVKAKRLRNYCRWYLEQGGLEPLSNWPTERLRRALLGINGVGPETADDILLYAFERPVFVVDAYTRRLFLRLRLLEGEPDYERVRAQFEQGLDGGVQRVALFNEYHALIVRHAKVACRKRPVCDGCCLRDRCPEAVAGSIG